LSKAEPDLDAMAKNALLTRQFMKGLPKSIRIKLLESDPTPDLNKMVSFVQRYRAIQEYTEDGTETHVAGVASESGDSMADLVALVSGIAERQKSLEEKVSKSQPDSEPTRNSSNKKCFVCKKKGHFAKEC